MTGTFTVTRTPKAPKKASTEEGVLSEDKYTRLWKDLEKQPAGVTMSVGRSMDFGSVRVQASVTLHCDQNKSAINKAGGLAFNKACELLNDGWELLVEEEGG